VACDGAEAVVREFTITQQCPIMHMIADKPVQKCQQ
jgi:hypothetical protein